MDAARGSTAVSAAQPPAESAAAGADRKEMFAKLREKALKLQASFKKEPTTGDGTRTGLTAVASSSESKVQHPRQHDRECYTASGVERGELQEEEEDCLGIGVVLQLSLIHI